MRTIAKPSGAWSVAVYPSFAAILAVAFDHRSVATSTLEAEGGSPSWARVTDTEAVLLPWFTTSKATSPFAIGLTQAPTCSHGQCCHLDAPRYISLVIIVAGYL